MKDRELMQMALLALDLWEDALTDPCANHVMRFGTFGLRASKALRDRLSQPDREWVGLTEEELDEFDSAYRAGAEWAERTLKEKNT